MSDETMDTLSLETYVARGMQSLMFVVCYCLCRIVASVSFWQSGLTGMKVFDLLFQLFIYGWTGFVVVPEAVVNTTVYWGLPPYCDDLNELTAVACQKRGAERAESNAAGGSYDPGEEAKALQQSRAKGASEAKEWARSIGAAPSMGSPTGAIETPGTDVAASTGDVALDVEVNEQDVAQDEYQFSV